MDTFVRNQGWGQAFLNEHGMERPMRVWTLLSATGRPLHTLPLLHRQLDKNQISCIEEGAFRALRGLEVL